MLKRLTKDENLALEFLNGQEIRNRDGTISHKYLKISSSRGREAQAALARLLRNHDRELNINIRWGLARLFEVAHEHEPRKLVIEARRPGPLPSLSIETRIGFDVAAVVRNGKGLVESAISDAMKRYGVSRATAMRAWEKHGKIWLKGLK